MIDFRYHIVSLVSVFLALAVGIVLGAGPLKETIGDALTDQVEVLRAEKDALHGELAETRAQAVAAEARFEAAVPGLLQDVLGERRIALILIDDVPVATVEAVTAMIERAGGSVSATAQLTQAWTDPARAAFRRSLSGSVTGYLDPPTTATEPAARLAEALVHGLVTAAPADPDALDADAAMVLELFVSSDLVEAAMPAMPADAVVVLAGTPPLEVSEAAEEDDAPAPDVPEEVRAHRERVAGAVSSVAVAAQHRAAGVVVGGDASDPTAPIAMLRAGPLAGAVSTVDSVNSLTGQVSVPLALAQRLGGQVGHFGGQQDAAAILPDRVALERVVRVPSAPEVPECVPDEDGSTEHCDDPEAEQGAEQEAEEGAEPGSEDAGTGDDGQAGG